jgi:hypothetical protein
MIFGLKSRIREIGFSGTVGIIWEDVVKMVRDKLKDEMQLEDMLRRSQKTVEGEMNHVALVSGRYYCTGYMIVEGCKSAT